MIDNVFEYQRAIAICKYLKMIMIIETSVLKYHFDSDQFIKLVVSGDVEHLDSERLQAFIKILPKQSEVQKLKEAIITHGCSSIEEAPHCLKFGQVERYMLKFLSIENLEMKTALCLKVVGCIE